MCLPPAGAVHPRLLPALKTEFCVLTARACLPPAPCRLLLPLNPTLVPVIILPAPVLAATNPFLVRFPCLLPQNSRLSSHLLPTPSRRLHQLRSESLPAACNNARLRPCPSNPRCMGIPRPVHGRPLCSILARLRGSHAPVLPAHPADHIPVSGIRLHGVAKRDPSSCMRYVAFHDALTAPTTTQDCVHACCPRLLSLRIHLWIFTPRPCLLLI